MLKAVNLAKTINYELDADEDKGTENATKFVLGAIDARVLGAIKDKATAIPVAAFGSGEGMASLNINQMNFEVVQHGLKGIVNYDKTYSTEIKRLGTKEYIVASSDFVASFEEDWISEIATAILEINSFNEAEVKNSEE